MNIAFIASQTRSVEEFNCLNALIFKMLQF